MAARAREALADPMLPPEAKAHVRQMLSELEAQEGQLAEVENQAHSMEASMAGEDATGIHSELSAMCRRCEAALMDPHLSAESERGRENARENERENARSWMRCAYR